MRDMLSQVWTVNDATIPPWTHMASFTHLGKLCGPYG